MRILVVEDERPLAAALHRALSAEGFDVELAHDGPTGRDRALRADVDALVLDVMLPGLSGYEICRAVRQAGRSTPILFLTAKDGEYDEADALDLGADDFLAKPFSPVVLVAHLRALLRRSAPAQAAVLVVGPLHLDPIGRRALLDGAPLALTPREHDLLTFLAQRSGQVVSKAELLAGVWEAGFADNVVEVHVGHLRRKLARQQVLRIETRRGHGYRLALRRS